MGALIILMPPKKKISKTPPKKMGAPTKYKPEYCQNIITFFVSQLTTIKPKLPFFSGYARKIGVNTDTLHEWKKTHKDFSEAYKKCKDVQKEILINAALQNKFNPSVSIFTAKNILGWRDITEIKQDIKTEHDISPALADMFNKIYKKET